MVSVMSAVTVAIPTLDAGPEFAQLLAAVSEQCVGGPMELVVCDSGSRDDTVLVARRYGARVIEIDRADFSHGGTRNLLMRKSSGEHVAFLTQDAIPADGYWLAALLEGFALADDIGLVFGPYRARPNASPMVVRELDAWFSSFAPGSEPRIDRLAPEEREIPAARLLGHRGYFTDANGCVARAAWERVPFREVGYAEDHVLAIEMLRAGFGKVYVPGAAVVHSHDYSAREWLRRSFDETRAIREVYGIAPAGELRTAARNLRGSVGADWRAVGRRPRILADSLLHHGARTAGALLGAHARSLPAVLRSRLSLEGRR
jgi:glycosyltransferase involved in cell wall biosynthesis